MCGQDKNRCKLNLIDLGYKSVSVIKHLKLSVLIDKLTDASTPKKKNHYLRLLRIKFLKKKKPTDRKNFSN